MPPQPLPPTPAASGEFIVKEAVLQSVDAMAEHSFALPPAALSPIAADRGIANPPNAYKSNSRKGSLVSQVPPSPGSPAGASERKPSVGSSARAGTKRSAAVAATTTIMAAGSASASASASTSASAALDEFNLPPPPTRSRKIIQMKPKTAPSGRGVSAATKQSPQRKAANSKSGPVGPGPSTKNSSNTASAMSADAANVDVSGSAGSLPSNGNNGSKKKQPSATSAAGRKIARKTAHSLIERRRRSKMNEEFATLKDMIPACRGQEMHKLAILQASIDYMNYLEECITELKNNASTAAGWTSSVSKRPRIDGPTQAPPSPTSPEMIVPFVASDESASAFSSTSSSPEPTQTSSNAVNHVRNQPPPASTYYSSPSFSPHTGPVTSAGQQIQLLDSVNHPILPSPALRPLYSPQLRAQQQQQQQSIPSHNDLQSQLQSYRVPQMIASATPSPAILPQQHQQPHQSQHPHRQSISSIHTASSMASPVFVAHDSIIDQEASAALLMLNMDRRGPPPPQPSGSESGAKDENKPTTSSTVSTSFASSAGQDRRMGMSVRDLLTS